MVGFVIVSYSGNLTKSVVELISTVAPGAKITQVGGMDDGGSDISPERTQIAIESVYSGDGVLVLMDTGSVVTITGMVIETYGGKRVEVVGCPLVEGAMVATINSMGGMSFEATKKALAGVGTSRKFRWLYIGTLLRKAPWG